MFFYSLNKYKPVRQKLFMHNVYYLLYKINKLSKFIKWKSILLMSQKSITIFGINLHNICIRRFKRLYIFTIQCNFYIKALSYLNFLLILSI